MASSSSCGGVACTAVMSQLSEPDQTSPMLPGVNCSVTVWYARDNGVRMPGYEATVLFCLKTCICLNTCIILSEHLFPVSVMVTWLGITTPSVTTMLSQRLLPPYTLLFQYTHYLVPGVGTGHSESDTIVLLSILSAIPGNITSSLRYCLRVRSTSKQCHRQ